MTASVSACRAVEEVWISSPPNCGKTSVGCGHRLDDRTFVYDTVGGKGFGGGGRVDRQFHGGRIRIAARDGRDLKAGGTSPVGCGREAHFDAVVGRHADAQASIIRQPGIGGLDGYVNGHGFIGLVLQHDRQFEAVAKVQEARRGRAHHQGQARGQVGFRRSRTGCRHHPQPPP